MRKIATLPEAPLINSAFIVGQEVAGDRVDEALATGALFDVLRLHSLFGLLQIPGKHAHFFPRYIYDQLFAAVAALCAVDGGAYVIINAVHLLVEQLAFQFADEHAKLLILLRLTFSLPCYESKIAVVLFQMI